MVIGTVLKSIFDLLIFLALLSSLVIAHEFGHFLAARLSGIRVEKFAIGFGPALFKRKIKETDVLICAVLIGGYVKLAGDSREESKGTPDEFLTKPVGIRSRVVFFGPLFNYLFAFVILWFLFIVGMPYLDSVVGEVVSDSPAQVAGITAGDKITQINGKEITGWKEMQRIIRSSAEESLTFGVERDGQMQHFVISPQIKKLKDIFGRERRYPVIGIRADYKIKVVRYNFFIAGYKGLERLGMLTGVIAQGFYYIVTGAIPVKESLAGPIELYRITAYTAQEGIVALLNLMSIISVSLALVNLFPIPVLDGGHLLLFGMEKLRRKPLSDHAETILTRIGIAIIGVIFFVVLYNDILRIIADMN